MDTPYEPENLLRSIAMLSPGARALDREQALRVLADLQSAQKERDDLRERLAARTDRSSRSVVPPELHRDLPNRQRT